MHERLYVNNGLWYIDCFGELRDDSNIQVVCQDEEQDDIWCIGNPITDEPFKTWQEAADFLSAESFFSSGILELSAV